MSNEFVKLGFVNNSLKAEQIITMLKEQGIASYSKSGIMKVYGGNSSENDIYVASKDYEKAESLFQTYFQDENHEEGMLQDRKTRFALMPKFVGVVLLVIMGLLMVVPFIKL